MIQEFRSWHIPQRTESRGLNKYLYIYVCSNISHNSQNSCVGGRLNWLIFGCFLSMDNDLNILLEHGFSINHILMIRTISPVLSFSLVREKTRFRRCGEHFWHQRMYISNQKGMSGSEIPKFCVMVHLRPPIRS